MARPTDDPKTARIDLRFPPRLIEDVDEWRRLEPDIPSRAEAIRRLVQQGFFSDPEMTATFFKIAQRWMKLSKETDDPLEAQEKDEITQALKKYARALNSNKRPGHIDEDGFEAVQAMLDELARR